MILTRKIDAYRFGSSHELNEHQLRTFISFFNQPHISSDSVLGGRTALTFNEIDGFGSVAIKSYTRGGWVRYLIKQRYLKLGKIRAQIEFELLQLVRNLGVNAPEPVAYAYVGTLVYKTWLITKAIDPAVSLTQLSVADEARTRLVMVSVVDQVHTLIEHNILHTDLHPGNVIVDRENQGILIDFDKGRTFSGSKNKLRDRYLRRWQRAIIKHGLPIMLNDIFLLGLDRNFETSQITKDFLHKD